MLDPVIERLCGQIILTVLKYYDEAGQAHAKNLVYGQQLIQLCLNYLNGGKEGGYTERDFQVDVLDILDQVAEWRWPPLLQQTTNKLLNLFNIYLGSRLKKEINYLFTANTYNWPISVDIARSLCDKDLIKARRIAEGNFPSTEEDIDLNLDFDALTQRIQAFRKKHQQAEFGAGVTENSAAENATGWRSLFRFAYAAWHAITNPTPATEQPQPTDSYVQISDESVLEAAAATNASSYLEVNHSDFTSMLQDFATPVEPTGSMFSSGSVFNVTHELIADLEQREAEFMRSVQQPVVNIDTSVASSPAPQLPTSLITHIGHDTAAVLLAPTLLDELQGYIVNLPVELDKRKEEFLSLFTTRLMSETDTVKIAKTFTQINKPKDQSLPWHTKTFNTLVHNMKQKVLSLASLATPEDRLAMWNDPEIQTLMKFVRGNGTFHRASTSCEEFRKLCAPAACLIPKSA